MRLVAEAQERSLVGRSGIYDVTVTAEGEVIAEFRGASRSIGERFLEG
jgi:acyl-CoA thioesterase